MLARRGAPAPSTRASGAIAAISRLEPVAQRADPRRASPCPPCASSQARPKPTMPGRFSVPGRQRRSCAAAAEQRRGLDARAQHQRADALRAAELVRRQRHKVDAQLLDIDRDFAGRLHRIAMHQGAVAAGAGDDLARPAGARRSRCWRASPRPAPAGASSSCSASACRSITPCRSTGIRTRIRRRRQDRIVLDRRDQPGAANALQCLVVRLGAAAREHHRIGRRADQRRDRCAGLLEQRDARRGRPGAPRMDCRSWPSAAATASGDLGPHRRASHCSRDSSGSSQIAPGHAPSGAFAPGRRKNAPCVASLRRRAGPRPAAAALALGFELLEPGGELLDLPRQPVDGPRHRVDRGAGPGAIGREVGLLRQRLRADRPRRDADHRGARPARPSAPPRSSRPARPCRP